MIVPFVSFKPLENEIGDKLRNAFERVLDRSWYILGEEDSVFEKRFSEYCGTTGCVGVGNGLDALILALKALGIGKGDEVIVPSNTYIATALAVTYVGAKIVLAEPNINTFNVDSNSIETLITSKTKAVIVVHLYGQPCDIGPIIEMAKKKGIYVIEDCAQAHGAKYNGQCVGTFGTVSGFSFYPGKNLGALGDAGAVVSNDVEVIDRVRILSNYGSDYKYHHIMKGNNSRLDELQAAFLCEKLNYLDKINENRRMIAKQYLDKIENSEIVCPSVIPNVEPVWHIFAVRCKRRDELAKYLKNKGIYTNMHYPIPIHMQECYKDMGYVTEDMPIAEEISETELSLPIFYGMENEQIEYVIEAINEFR